MPRTDTADPNEPLVIRTYRFAYEAELARATLDAADIPCQLLGDSTSEAIGLPVRLAVRRDQVAEAVAVLDAPAVDDIIE
jgi:hypothetical protein